MAHEMRSEGFIYRLDGRTFDVFATDSDWTFRTHVDLFGVMAKDLDDGGAKIRVGYMIDGQLRSAGASARLTAEEWTRFQALYELVKAARVAGPEPW